MPPQRLRLIQAALPTGLALLTQAALAADEALRDLPMNRFVELTSLEALADMVVTDTKVAQSIDTVTQKIVVLRGSDLVRQPDGYRNLAELMRYTSGQFVNVLSRNDANWGSYAGLGPKYNSYLLDGLPIDSFVDPMSLDLDAIERIEVHKGPASVLYSNYLTMDFAGNETPLAGTTNFVLKDRIETPLTRMSAGMGSWDTFAGRLYRQGRAGELSYIVGASAETSDYAQYGAAGSWLQTVEAPDYAKTRLFGRLSYQLDRPDHTVALFAHLTRHDGDMGRPNRDFEHQYDTLDLSYGNQLSKHWHLQFKAGQRDYDRAFGNDGYPASLLSTGQGTTRQTLRPMDLTLSYRHGEHNLLTVGIDHQTVDYRTFNRDAAGVSSLDNDVQASSTGYFLQDKIQWRDWVFRAGVRHNTIQHDYALLGGKVPTTDSATWSKNLWSLGLRHGFSPTLAAYANAGTSFMTPAAKQIGGTVALPGDSGQLPNPGLRPESGLGQDLGLDWQPTAGWNLGLRLFDNKLDDAIVDNVVSVSPSQTQSVNAGKARSHGIELDVRHAPSADWSWFANLTRTATRVENPGNPDQDGTAIPFAPDIVANLGLSTSLPWRLNMAAYVHWVGHYYDSTSRAGRQDFGGYGVINLRLRQAWRADLELVLDLNNIGDRDFDMPWGFRDPGFNGFASLHYSF